jgi:hypothetical protein
MIKWKLVNFDRNNTRFYDGFGCVLIYFSKNLYLLSALHLLSPTTSEAPVGGKLGGPCAPDDYGVWVRLGSTSYVHGLQIQRKTYRMAIISR